MQKISGQGIAFLEIDGKVIEYDLAPRTKSSTQVIWLYMEDSVRWKLFKTKDRKNKSSQEKDSLIRGLLQGRKNRNTNPPDSKK